MQKLTDQQKQARAELKAALGAMPWKQKLYIWSIVGPFYALFCVAIGAALGAVGFGVWWLVGTEPNFWLCWAIGSVATLLYIIASFYLDD